LSATPPAPGTQRPRGRTERVRQAVLAATRSELAGSGYAALTVDRVAEAAGVAKSTVYRRWRDTAGLLLELLDDLSTSEIPFADTGSVDEDARALAVGIAHLYSDHVAGTMVLALIAEAVHNATVADELRRFWAVRNDRAAEIVRAGVAAGQLPDGTDPVEVIRAIGAPIYYRLLVTREPVDRTVAERAADAALAAARAGTLDTSPRPEG
jgi:AcrR family transcriptional regulator